jgi:hypothetical protein
LKFSENDFRPGSDRMETARVRCTSVFLAEQVHHFLQILRRQARIDGRRLDVGVTEVLLHRTEVSA